MPVLYFLECSLGQFAIQIEKFEVSIWTQVIMDHEMY